MTTYYILERFKGDYMLSVQPIDLEKLEKHRKIWDTIATEEDLSKLDAERRNGRDYIYNVYIYIQCLYINKLLADKAATIANELLLEESKNDLVDSHEQYLIYLSSSKLILEEASRKLLPEEVKSKVEYLVCLHEEVKSKAEYLVCLLKEISAESNRGAI